MKFHIVFALFFVTIFSSCSERAPKPKPFLSEKKMVKLLTEVHLLEASLQQLQQNRHYKIDSVHLYTNAAYAELFKKYKLNQESFEANLYYRTYNSRDLEKIFTQVNDILKEIDDENMQKTTELSKEMLEIDR